MKVTGRRVEQLGLALIGGIVLVLVGLAAPRAVALLASPAPTPTPLPAATPPAAVLLQDELDRDLQGVFILVVETRTTPARVGTAFAIDAHNDLLTSADLVRGATAIRLIDPTGGSHAAGLVAVDESLDLALLRAPIATVPLPLGDPAPLRVQDPLALLASAKAAALNPSTPVTIVAVGVEATGPRGAVGGLLELAGDVRPAASGAPVVGPGGKVMGIAILVPDSETLAGYALPVSAVAPELAPWSGRPAALLPLAAVPPSLLLRGVDETAALPSPTGETSPRTGPVSLQSVEPARALSRQDTVLTLHGAGFMAGPSLRVHFLPSASLSGSFDGVKAAVSNPSTITVTVPAGMRIQDYAIEVVNGDGSMAGSRLSFTVVP